MKFSTDKIDIRNIHKVTFYVKSEFGPDGNTNCDFTNGRRSENC